MTAETGLAKISTVVPGGSGCWCASSAPSGPRWASRTPPKTLAATSTPLPPPCAWRWAASAGGNTVDRSAATPGAASPSAAASEATRMAALDPRPSLRLPPSGAFSRSAEASNQGASRSAPAAMAARTSSVTKAAGRPASATA